MHEVVKGMSRIKGAASPKRAVGYVRVSTGDQALHGVSIPVQEEKIREYCKMAGLELVRVFTDKARTGRNPRRPGLQALKDFTLAPRNDIQTVVVYNFSRMMRNILHLEQLVEQLDRAGKTLRSVQQPLGEGPAGDFMRRHFASGDQYDSDLKAEVTLDAMLHNARNGYWNGSKPPYGFKAEIVDIIGNRTKRRLAIDEMEAPIVSRVFELYRAGDGSTGPLGCQALARWLNSNGFHHRDSKAFTIRSVHNILRNQAVTGTIFFNRTCSRTGETKPEEEWVRLEVPAIIKADIFAAVQDMLSDKNPFKGKQPPRAVSSPLLLSGLVTCGLCGQHLRRATGKGYIYYSCGHAAESTGCTGRRLPADKLDPLVLDAVFERSFSSSRLSNLTTGLRRLMLERKGSLRQELDGARAELNQTLRDTDRHITLLAKTDLDVVQDRITEKLRIFAQTRKALEQRIATLEAQMQEARRQPSRKAQRLFTAAFRPQLDTAPAPAVRAWLETQIQGIVARDCDIHITYK
jgi:DNA invertase Pin-like site-specific DNA recombinase